MAQIGPDLIVIAREVEAQGVRLVNKDESDVATAGAFKQIPPQASDARAEMEVGATPARRDIHHRFERSIRTIDSNAVSRFRLN